MVISRFEALWARRASLPSLRSASLTSGLRRGAPSLLAGIAPALACRAAFSSRRFASTSTMNGMTVGLVDVFD